MATVLIFDQLTAKRRGLRSQVTKKCLHLSDLQQDPVTNSIEITALLSTVKTQIDQLDLIHLAMEPLFPVDDFEEELEHLEDYRLRYNRVAALHTLLPSNHHVVRLMVNDVHNSNLHAGISTMLLLLREKFWIIGARKLVKQCIHECPVCVRYAAKHFSQPIAVLPAFRTANVAPFVHVGLDFAGPIYLYSGDKTVKNYIALFTCSTTRGVHLELVQSLSADDFILALRRFIARRGSPSIIYSDNATNFKSTARQLQQSLFIQDDYEVENYLASKFIHWHHIVEDAPWWGGHWERMIRAIKEPLRKSLGKTTLDSEHFVTLLTEVEAVVNNRPLMTIYDSHEQFNVITPAELMLGRPLSRIAVEGVRMDEDLSTVYELRSKFFNHFVATWKKLYLGQLRSLHIYESDKKSFPSVNHIVVIDESPKKNQLWPIARIIETHPSKDGLIRSCTVETLDGRILSRAVQRLVPLPEATGDQLGLAGSVENRE